MIATFFNRDPKTQERTDQKMIDSDCFTMGFDNLYNAHGEVVMIRSTTTNRWHAPKLVPFIPRWNISAYEADESQIGYSDIRFEEEL